jgi:hypothetical protein
MLAPLAVLALLGVKEPPPQPIVFKRPTMTFSTSWEIAIIDGRIWRGPLGENALTLLPPDGLPAPKGRLEAWKELVPLTRAFVFPTKILELSADGENLVAIGDDGRVYYTKLGTLDWDDVWGPPGIAAPLSLPAGNKGWAISHRKIPYADVDGNVHPVSAGVTTLYALTADDRIVYADPWLPPAFDHEMCPPERGRVVLVALSASASTMAVMDEGGRVYTRLADFDVVGNNPALPYSWTREKREGVLENVRTLPGEDWVEQPRIPGRHTSLLTIFQTAPGPTDPNGARTLRVEGDRGYWEKHLRESAWRFVKAPGIVVTQPFVDDRPAATKPPRGARLGGRLKKLDIVVDDFFLACPGAPMTVRRGDEEVHMRLWFTDRLIEWSRRTRDLAGAVVLEPGQRGPLADAVREAFGGELLEVEVDVRADDDGAVRRVELKAQKTAEDPRRKLLQVTLRPARP